MFRFVRNHHQASYYYSTKYILGYARGAKYILAYVRGAKYILAYVLGWVIVIGLWRLYNTIILGCVGRKYEYKHYIINTTGLLS
jgi:hypothetical protein